jgi:hypothetical protein
VFTSNENQEALNKVHKKSHPIGWPLSLEL